ncbi:MAG: PQQ-dependent sugar dehydrogenase, partial [Ardenticatenales bacterium]
MPKRPLAACALFALALILLPTAPSSTQASRSTAARARTATLPAGFAETLIADGLNSPVAMTVAPDGRVFIAEQGGALRVVENEALVAAPVLNVETTADSELGLVGVALMPGFPQQPFVYVTRTTDQPTRHNQIVRYKVTGNSGASDSGSIVADLDDLAATDRVAGALRFGPDGMLYAATGDNTDGMKAQDLGSTHGKLLRFGPDGEIPADNPHAGDAQGRYRAIWASGLRNPFTFAFEPGSGRLFINDVGASGFEEIDEGAAGANYGWPMTEGPTAQPGFTTPFFSYSHARGCAIQGGAFYSPDALADAPFPADYTDLYFFMDYCTGEIRTIDPALLTDFSVFGTASTPGPVDLAVAPDGGLYYLARGTTAAHGGSGAGFDAGRLYKIHYVGSGKPTISLPPADTTASVDTMAHFTVRASGTPSLRYRWQRDGVDIPGATARDLALGPVQLADDGAQIRVIVENDQGSATSDPARLTVVNRRPPVITFDLPTPGFKFRNGALVTFAGHAVDPEDGPLPASALTWRIDLHQGGDTYPLMPALAGVVGGSHMVDVEAHPQGDGFLRIELQATDSDGQTTIATRDIPPDLVDLTIDTEPAGLSVVVDSQPITAPATAPSIIGTNRTVSAPQVQTVAGTVYAFEGWSDGGAALHSVAISTSPLALTARYGVFSGSVPIVDWGGDYVDTDAGLRGADGGVENKIDIDRDGLYNDQRFTIPLSDVTPLSPAASRQGSSWRFFGGLILESYDRPFEYKWTQIWAESPVKPNDKLYYGASPGTIGWDLRYWKKEDFLGEGNAREVALDESSQIELIHYEGGDGIPQNNSGVVRIVVKDGEQWFISKAAGLPSTSSATFALRTVRAEEWALYSPQPPNRIRFKYKPEITLFEPHVFRDVQAVGYLHSNDNIEPPAADARAGFTVERVRVSAHLGDPATPRPSSGASATPGTPATTTPVTTPTPSSTPTDGPSPTPTHTLRPGETPPPTDTPEVVPSDTPAPGSTTARPTSTITPTFTPTRATQTSGPRRTIYLPLSAKTSSIG